MKNIHCRGTITGNSLYGVGIEYSIRSYAFKLKAALKRRCAQRSSWIQRHGLTVSMQWNNILLYRRLQVEHQDASRVE